jgi:hypothetical protein
LGARRPRRTLGTNAHLRFHAHRFLQSADPRDTTASARWRIAGIVDAEPRPPGLLLDAKPLASGFVEQLGLPSGGVTFGPSTGPGTGGGVGSDTGT